MRDDYQLDEPVESSSTPSVRPSLPYQSVTQSLPPIATPNLEMLARGTIFVGFREATLKLWGKAGLEHVAALLPDDVRSTTVDRTVSDVAWLPESYVLAWYQALWSGPCRGSRELFIPVLNRMMDFSFGRVRKGLLALANPSKMIVKAGALWRFDHTHGDLTVEAAEGAAQVRLENHPYTEHALSCMAIAEIWRYCVALCRARGVTETHYREPSGALVVRVRWDA